MIARLGKEAFLEHVSGAEPAPPARVREFLEEHGFEPGSRWRELEICDGIFRSVNVGWSLQAVDAFVDDRAAELKATASDGISGLTLSSERLARLGLVDVYVVNLTDGRIGRARTKDVLEIPRRLDGVPRVIVRLIWPGEG